MFLAWTIPAHQGGYLSKLSKVQKCPISGLPTPKPSPAFEPLVHTLGKGKKPGAPAVAHWGQQTRFASGSSRFCIKDHRKSAVDYPLVMTNSLLLKPWPSRISGFTHFYRSFVNVYQRVLTKMFLYPINSHYDIKYIPIKCLVAIPSPVHNGHPPILWFQICAKPWLKKGLVDI